MARGWKIVGGMLLFALVLLVTISVLSYRLLTKSLPETAGTQKLSILQAPVKVFRDEFGVPHIFAENELDLFRAAGYVTAQDRLWQMDFNRRVATGRLSEIFGDVSLENDKFLRVWGFHRLAREIVNVATTEALAVLQAYADGVNAFIDSHKDKLPIEFSLLRYRPEKWKIEDSIAYARLMAWKLSFSWYVEPVLAQLVDKLGLAKAAEVFPGFPKQGPYIISPDIRPFWTSAESFLNQGLRLREFLGIGGTHLGSNSWVVSGEKSYCGKPLLANDPHLELTAPSVWYEMHLSAGDLDVAGVTLPGVPGVLIGHNRYIAWGLTNGMVDDMDFFQEKINPDNPHQYWHDGHWQDMEIVREKIGVRDADSVEVSILLTQNGPIISQMHPLLRDSLAVYSVRWVGQEPSDEVTAFLKLQKARNWSEFKEALRFFKVPAQNFVFASVDGDIGYYLAGAVPIRKDATGILPHKAWLEKGKWIGEIPFDKLPHVLNPPQNYLVTANNKIIDDRYPYYLTNLWEPPSRSARIHQRLQEKEKFTLEDFKSIQMDLVSVHAQTVLPMLLQAVKMRLQEAPNGPLETLYDLIKDWDGEESARSVATSIFHAFFLKLTENTLKDEMGEELYHRYIHFGNVPNRVMVALLKNERSSWFDNVTTPERETRDDILVKSLLDAGEWLKTLVGENISNWRWGEIHRLVMPHPLGRRKPLDTLFNLGPFPRGGSTMTVNNSEYRFDRPFDAFLGPSTRQLVDLCDVDAALAVLPTGQSGHWRSKHYKDQTPLWLNGDYHPMPLDSSRVAQLAVEVLELVP